MSEKKPNVEKTMYQCLYCCAKTRKYKCSKCLMFYCSYECYKNHKVNYVCLDQTFDYYLQKREPADEPEPTQHEFKSYDEVPPDRLARLKTAEEVKHKLYNPHLRKLLKNLDCDTRAWYAMQEAMQEPLFVEFADECLKVVEPENAAADKS